MKKTQLLQLLSAIHQIRTTNITKPEKNSSNLINYRNFTYIENKLPYPSHITNITKQNTVSVLLARWQRYRLDGPGFVSWKGGRGFSLLQNVHTGSRTHPTSYLVDTPVLSWGLSSWVVTLTSHIRLVSRLRPSGPYIRSWQRQRHFILQFYCYNALINNSYMKPLLHICIIQR